jgi:hypothetical protein
MATTTTNFGWDIPQSTDLVKDGATAIAALGQDIDTALVDLKGGTTGQVLSKASGADLDYTWVAQDDSNAIQNAIVDAKGDLIAATANDTPARLAVGANNTFLRANSGAATGLEYAGAYTTFTPSYFNLTVGNGTNTGRYLRIGNLVHATYKFVFGSTSSIAGNVFLDFPINANTANNNSIIGVVALRDIGTQDYQGPVVQNSTTNFTVQANTANATYVTGTALSSTVPFTWTTNDELLISIIYEAA